MHVAYAKCRKTCRLMIGFGFTSHWSRNWLEIFVPTAKRSKGKPKQMLITFDTQVERALISRFGCASSKFDEACGLQAIPHRKLTVFVPREAESKEGVSLANQKLFSLPAVFYIFSVFYFSYILYLVFLLIYRPRYQRQNDNNTQVISVMLSRAFYQLVCPQTYYFLL